MKILLMALLSGLALGILTATIGEWRKWEVRWLAWIVLVLSGLALIVFGLIVGWMRAMV